MVLTKRDIQEAVREEIRASEKRIIGEIDEVDEKFVKVDERFDEMDEKFVKVDERFDEMDEKFVKVDKRFDESEVRILKSVQKMFEDQTLTLRGWLDDFSKTVEISYAKKERIEELEGRVDELEDVVGRV